jgi:hypothetical protein
MPSISQAIQAVLDNVPVAMEIGKDAVEYAKPFLASGLAMGKHASNSAAELARPFIQTSFEAGKNASAAAFVHIKPNLLQYADLREILNALIAHAKLLFSSGLQAGKRALQHIVPLLLALSNEVWEKVCQHPLVFGFATLYALLSLVLGPFWPLGIVLRIAGFGVKGVVFGE